MHDDPFARAVERVEAAEQAQQQSKRRRREAQFSEGNRTGFRVHATVYIAVNLLLIAIWFTAWQLNDATSYPWFLWVLLGWGIGLAAHYAAARNHIHGKPAASGDAPAAPQAAAQTADESTSIELARLSELHRSGDLTEDEFTAAKAKLLR